MNSAEHADRLSRQLRAEFPGLTCFQIKWLWGVVGDMKRGEIYPQLADLKEVDLIVALHLAIERTFRDRENYEKIIRRLSAHDKRRAFPRSYEEEKEK